jgi:hypothetical protein
MRAQRRFGVAVLGVAALTILAIIGNPAYAAPITWGPVTGISGDSDVSTTGTLVNAVFVGFDPNGGPPNFVPPNQTVNGVTFQAIGLNSSTSGNFTINPTIQAIALNGSGSAPYSGLSGSYQTLLADLPSGGGTAFTLTMSGLTVGDKYQFEWWYNKSDLSNAFSPTTAMAVNSVTLNANPTNTEGALGQFAIGGFTADATSEVVTFTAAVGSEAPGFNALQLRDLGPSAPPGVPEPSTLALLALGGGALAGWRRWRKQKVA